MSWDRRLCRDFGKNTGKLFCSQAGVEDQSKWKGQHNPKILFNEKHYRLAQPYAKIAMDWLAK